MFIRKKEKKRSRALHCRTISTAEKRCWPSSLSYARKLSYKHPNYPSIVVVYVVVSTGVIAQEIRPTLVFFLRSSRSFPTRKRDVVMRTTTGVCAFNWEKRQIFTNDVACQVTKTSLSFYLFDYSVGSLFHNKSRMKCESFRHVSNSPAGAGVLK